MWAIKNAAGTNLALIAAILALSLPIPASAQNPDQQRLQAEQQLADLGEEIAELQQALNQARSDHQKEQQELRQLDLAIDQTARQTRELEAQHTAHQQALERLEEEREEQLVNMGTQRDQLAEIMRSAYQADRNSRLKLVLNQDDPTRLNRMLAYYEYVNFRHIENITLLRESLEALEATHREISDQLAALAETRARLNQSLEQLGGQRESRVNLIAQLNSQIGDDQARLRELERNRQDLVQLLERLENALADIPADLGSRLGVGQQKGKLPMPLSGKVLHAFGQTRAGTLSWQGWLVSAEAGTEVQAVAYGRVAFADWLRGYGLMLIIDHGDGFLSLYGNNESLFAEVGDWVEPGDLVSAVGTNPGMTQGLYFELRKDGKAVDPAAWIKR